MNANINPERVYAAYNKLMDKGEFRDECCDELGVLIGNGFMCDERKANEINAMCDAILAE